jgi:hypothetical protein
VIRNLYGALTIDSSTPTKYEVKLKKKTNEIRSMILVLDAQIPKHFFRGYRLESQNYPPDRILT